MFNFYHNLPEIARSGGFKFCKEEDRDSSQIDWRFIATTDIHKIIKECDYEKIDECVPFLIKSSISDLFNSKALDPVIGKIYNLSQLSLEYLLFCTRFLDKSVSSLRESLYDYQKQNVELQAIINERDLEIAQLNKNLKIMQVARDDTLNCFKCLRKFESQELLDEHTTEAHQQYIKEKDSNLIKAIKLELEVKQLKEKLNLTEKELMSASTEAIKICEKCQMNISRTFNSIGIQINSEEKERDEMEKEQETSDTEKLSKFNDTIRSFMSEHFEKFQQEKQNEEMRHQEEMAQLKELLDKAIKSLKKTESQHEIFVATTAPSPAPRRSIQNEKKIFSGENDSLWKTRFQELEKMYEYNQSQMAKSMKDMEQAYSEKMQKLEKSINQLLKDKIIENSIIKPKQQLLSKKIEIREKTNDELESESSIFDDQKNIEVDSKHHNTNFIKQTDFKNISSHAYKENEKIKKTFSGQKNIKIKQSVEIGDNKTVAINLLNQRMREIGLPRHSKQLNSAYIERIHSELVSRRENIKKRYKDFYIKRKNIRTKIEKIYSDINNNEEQTPKQIALVHSTNYALAQQLEFSEAKKNEENSLNPTENQQNKLKDNSFQEKLEKILLKKIDDEKPKKKVLFNLEKYNENLRIQNEDDSDFNITSFEEDLK